MTRSAASVLVNIAEGRGLLGVETGRKPGLHLALQRATGCRPGAGRDHHRIYMAGRRVTHDMPDDLCAEVGASMSAWLAGAGDEPPAPVAMSMPEGAVEIVGRCGVSLGRALVLLETLHHVAFDGPARARVTLRRLSRGPTLDYTREGVVRWHDGLVTVRHRALPRTMADALTGSTLSAVVDDEVLADRRIRKVCDVEPREGRLRIVTMDEGRRRIINEGVDNG